jgi:hypothetical protein
VLPLLRYEIQPESIAESTVAAIQASILEHPAAAGQSGQKGEKHVPILRKTSLCLPIIVAATGFCGGPEKPSNIAFTNGNWFNGESFEVRQMYVVGGRFTRTRPATVDVSLDLTGLWIVPPFGDAHNHSIGNIVAEWDTKAIRHYLADGVFYVKIQANHPLSDEEKTRRGINRPDSIDVKLAQAAITASGGHPFGLVKNVLMPLGYFPGRSLDDLKDVDYFVIDSEQDLERKWPAILRNKPDFIKTFLAYSDEYEKRKDDPAYFGDRGLDPRILARIVEKAHAVQLRVSVHVNTSTDVHNALAAGADEIAHVPCVALTPISLEDAQLASKHGVVVDTTCSRVRDIPPDFLPDKERPQVLKTQVANLKLLHAQGVTLAIGSDLPSDTTLGEVEYLRGLRIFDDLTLLKMWAEATPQSIFPERKIGRLEEGFEASFIALEGNPLQDFKNANRIKLRCKQGVLLQ